MAKRRWPNPVNDTELDCLVMWPPGTVGESQEQAIVRVLNKLCRTHGYGRVPQLAQQIENLWRDASKAAEYEREKQNHLKFLRGGQ